MQPPKRRDYSSYFQWLPPGEPGDILKEIDGKPTWVKPEDDLEPQPLAEHYSKLKRIPYDE